jgi:hypothetical protein
LTSDLRVLNVVGVTEISAIVAAVSVVVGVVLTVVELRNLVQQRKSDLLVRLFSTVGSKDWLEAWMRIRDRETLDYDDYKEKYGFVEANEVFVFFEMAGRLVKKRLIDIDLLPFAHGQVKATWEKMNPILEGSRKRFNEQRIGYGFEYLYNEMKKREQKLQRKS